MHGHPNNLMVEEDDGGLAGLHNQLENLDREEAGDGGYMQDGQHMMNDQNLQMMGVADDMDGEDLVEDEDEGQHHPDDDDEDLEDGQELFQLDQLE